MTSPTLSFPPLAAIFLTHFDDIKGQSVLYYKSSDEERISQGTIEHTSLPSGLHLLEEDFFGFRHGSQRPDLQGSGERAQFGAGLFRSRSSTGQNGEGSSTGRGRGRRMATLGVVLADGDVDDLFELKPAIGVVYDRLETNLEVFSSSDEGRRKLDSIMDDIWDKYRTKSVGGGQISSRERVRGLVDGSRTVSSNHPITFLPSLINILGPQIMTVYKAALAGRRILIYSPPPLMPLSAFAWCITAMSLPPSLVPGCSLSTWLGQVGLMDLEGLYTTKGPWVANKILLSHHKVYDLSIDLSGTIPDTDHTSLSTSSTNPHVEIHSTSPETPHIRPATYTFSDIPLYKSLKAIADASPTPSQESAKPAETDWWITLYDLVDRVWTICAGVCEYAVGRGRVGAGALSLGPDEGDEDGDENRQLLLDDDGEDGTELGEEDEAVRRGRLILRQLHHNTFHIHASLVALRVGGGGGDGETLTLKQVREVTGKWIVKEDEAKFYGDLARRWKVGAGAEAGDDGE